MAALVKVVAVNEATLKLFGAQSAEGFFNNIINTFGPDSVDGL
jgi:hypothetical protein